MAFGNPGAVGSLKFPSDELLGIVGRCGDLNLVARSKSAYVTATNEAPKRTKRLL